MLGILVLLVLLLVLLLRELLLQITPDPLILLPSIGNYGYGLLGCEKVQLERLYWQMWAGAAK